MDRFLFSIPHRTWSFWCVQVTSL